MRRFFHLRTGDELIPDEEGTDLPNFSAAQREALLGARELLAEAIKNGKQKVPDAFVIVDEAGQALETLLLSSRSAKILKKVRAAHILRSARPFLFVEVPAIAKDLTAVSASAPAANPIQPAGCAASGQRGLQSQGTHSCC